MKRYLCPIHKEDTPSVILYGERAWCFGCSRQIPLDMLGVSVDVTFDNNRHVEDLNATLNYIDSLPEEQLRGLKFKSGPRGYYVVWPDRSYYKLRTNGDSSRYVGPAGHKKPLFILANGFRDVIVVEGEINALSLKEMGLNADIVSPGGAGDFYSKSMLKQYISMLLTYKRVYIITDADGPGAKAAIELKSALVAKGKRDVTIHLDTVDANDRLQSGKEEARKFYKKTLGL